MFISSPLIRGGGRELGGVGKRLLEPSPVAPSPTVQLCRQQRNCPPIQATLVARDGGTWVLARIWSI